MGHEDDLPLPRPVQDGVDQLFQPDRVRVDVLTLRLDDNVVLRLLEEVEVVARPDADRQTGVAPEALFLLAGIE